jgi:hypothetical protein
MTLDSNLMGTIGRIMIEIWIALELIYHHCLLSNNVFWTFFVHSVDFSTKWRVCVNQDRGGKNSVDFAIVFEIGIDSE